MKTLTLLAIAAVASASYGQAQTTLTTTAGQFTVHANSFTGSPNQLSGLTDFSVTNILGDYSYRHMFAYRQTGDTREYSLSDSAATFNSTTNTFHARVFRNVNNVGADTLQFDVYYNLSSLTPTAPMLQWCVIVTNVSNSVIDYSLFAYTDFDIPDATGSATMDNVFDHQNVGGGLLVKQQNVNHPSNYLSTFIRNASGFQHDVAYEQMFSNPWIDNLNNFWNTANGDMAIGFQFFGTLQPGQSSFCPGQATVLNGEVPVPEPATILATALGLAALIRRRGARR